MSTQLKLTRKGSLVVGMLGWAAENIKRGETGLCWFPTGPEDPRFRYGFKWEKHRVEAVEDVRAYRDVVIIDETFRIKEHTPVEAKILGYIYDDYAEIPFTDKWTRYEIGTQAYLADKSLPSKFLAEKIILAPTQDCYVRFEGENRVSHLLSGGAQYEYPRRTDTLWVKRRTTDGVLVIRAFGNEVGV